jgi:hypothetical protein
VTPPAKVPSPSRRRSPSWVAEIKPLLTTAPPLPEPPNIATLDNPIPLVPTILPLLLMSPRKVAAFTDMPPPPEIVPAFVIPLATLPAPKRVPSLKSMPPPMILPALPLTMLPKKVSTVFRKTSPCIVPVFVIPPAPLLFPKTPTSVTRMLLTAAAILPLLLIPPAKVPTVTTAMALWPAEIVPLLTIPPPALPFPKTATLTTSMPSPVVAVILPLLLTPPKSVDTPVILLPVPGAEMTPLLVMPPAKVVKF